MLKQQRTCFPLFQYDDIYPCYHIATMLVPHVVVTTGDRVSVLLCRSAQISFGAVNGDCFSWWTIVSSSPDKHTKSSSALRLVSAGTSTTQLAGHDLNIYCLELHDAEKVNILPQRSLLQCQARSGFDNVQAELTSCLFLGRYSKF